MNKFTMIQNLNEGFSILLSTLTGAIDIVPNRMLEKEDVAQDRDIKKIKIF